MSITPSTTLYDAVSGSVSSITLAADVTKKSYNIDNVTFYVGGTVVNTITSDVSAGGNFSYVYTPDSPITTNTTFKVTATDVESKSASSSKSITFVGRSYYGTVSSDVSTVTEALVHTLGTVLKNSKVYEYQNITMDYGKVLYAYPTSLGNLSSIKDEVNNFNYTNSFTKSVVSVDGIDYNCYLLTEPTIADSVTLKFS